MADWTEKYRPTTLSEVRGNDSARDDLLEWAETWPDHREAVVVHGSPGVGKTSAAHALAADMGWPTIELNASDQRTADVVERVAGEAARSSTLTQAAEGEPGRRLVVLDEADNLHGNADRGGARALTELVKEAAQPVVLLANDYYDMTRGLRSNTREIEFRDVSPRSIVPVLRDVCRKEGVEFEEAALERIADRNAGDLRGAITDLQMAAEGRETITVEDATAGDRDRTKGIFEFLDAVLKEEAPEDALRLSYDVDEAPDDLLRWVEDKAPKVLEGPELAAAYDRLADADRWLGRVRATQNYSYWRYAADNVAAGVAAARSETRGGWTRYGGAPYRSSRDATRDYVAERVAETAGVSTATARREVLPFLAAMTHHCRDRELTVRMAARYDLDADHVAFVTGSGASTNKVESIVADAAERRAEATAAHGGAAFAPGPAGTDDGGADSGGDDDQSTLGDADETAAGGTDAGDDEAGDDEPDPEARAADAGDDDQQSGLGDFT